MKNHRPVPRLLETKDVQKIVARVGANRLMAEVIDELESKLLTASFEMVPRRGFSTESGLLEWMPSMDNGQKVGLKMVSYHPCNADQHSLPTILATVGIYDAASGQIEFLMDGTLLTALRTGALSAIASRNLAHPKASTLGLVGCGCQAVTQLQALAEIRPWTSVLTYDIDKAQEKRFAQRVVELGISPAPVTSAPLERLVAEADVICVATSVAPGQGPVIESGWNHKPWLHINAVGSDYPGKIEISKELLMGAFVCPDQLSQAIEEGECQQLEAGQIGPELEELLKSPVAGLGEKLTVFDSTGPGIADLWTASYFRDKAERFGLGLEVDMVPNYLAPKDPYAFLDSAVESAVVPS